MSAVKCGYLHSPISYTSQIETEYDPNPSYNYHYGVDDPLTGDTKSQIESRNGDVVRGRYTVVDPDGIKRTVDYTADAINGFNAIISKTPVVTSRLVQNAPVAHQPPLRPILHAAPIAPVQQQQSQVAYSTSHVSTPISDVAYTAQHYIEAPQYNTYPGSFSVRVHSPANAVSYSYSV